MNRRIEINKFRYAQILYSFIVHSFFCLLTSKRRDHSYCGDVMIRYLIRGKKILKVKSRSKMIVLKCQKFSSIIVQKI